MTEVDQKTAVIKLEQFIRPKMTNEAWERYQRVKMAHPQVSREALAIMAQSVKNNKSKMIDDLTVRSLLSKIKG